MARGSALRRPPACPTFNDRSPFLFPSQRGCQVAWGLGDSFGGHGEEKLSCLLQAQSPLPPLLSGDTDAPSPALSAAGHPLQASAQLRLHWVCLLRLPPGVWVLLPFLDSAAVPCCGAEPASPVAAEGTRRWNPEVQESQLSMGWPLTRGQQELPLSVCVGGRGVFSETSWYLLL